MDFNEYMDATADLAVYPEAGEGTVSAVTYTVMGLVGEAGEVANQAKRILRDDNETLTPDRLEKLKKELGDVLWYVARACDELDLDLEDVAVTNIARLEERKKHGTLHGEGDDR